MKGTGSFTLGEGVGMTGGNVVTASFTLGDGSGWVVGSILGDWARTGISVALLNIWASCM